MTRIKDGQIVLGGVGGWGEIKEVGKKVNVPVRHHLQGQGMSLQ